jgi:hypothetical protein
MLTAGRECDLTRLPDELARTGAAATDIRGALAERRAVAEGLRIAREGDTRVSRAQAVRGA